MIEFKQLKYDGNIDDIASLHEYLAQVTQFIAQIRERYGLQALR